MLESLQNLSWRLDGWIIAAGMLCAVSAALLGNFLVLRRMSMMGDAISHAVLPGLAAAFFLTESRASLPMFLGAAVVGVLTAVFTEWVRSYGKVDEGASMGVVFTALFALGLIMVVQAADHVDLDPGCVLYGAIELTPLNTIDLWGRPIPQVVVTLSIVLVVNLLFTLLFYKELQVSSFDPELSTTIGVSARLMHYLLMTLVAVTAVASFESVGNILVVAMFIVPPAAAHMLTDRLPWMIAMSAVIAALAAALGHISAIAVPALFGFPSTTTAGMMAVAAGGLFALAVLFAPRHGVVSRIVHRGLLTLRIVKEDILGLLYRAEEAASGATLTADQLRRSLLIGPTITRLALAVLSWRGRIASDGNHYRLTPQGHREASLLLRSHRLWEHYLVSEAEVGQERTHRSAERLEHVTSHDMRRSLDESASSPNFDPHGRPIPPEK